MFSHCFVSVAMCVRAVTFLVCAASVALASRNNWPSPGVRHQVAYELQHWPLRSGGLLACVRACL